MQGCGNTPLHGPHIILCHYYRELKCSKYQDSAMLGSFYSAAYILDIYSVGSSTHLIICY